MNKYVAKLNELLIEAAQAAEKEAKEKDDAAADTASEAAEEKEDTAPSQVQDVTASSDEPEPETAAEEGLVNPEEDSEN